ncbi:hypothetical protein AAEX28_09830 [Lentisphaerota bacterium WC36G]|nr:hypothetical protein LJT99_12665 [Lentisphaerae bacterium WC36]
MKNKFEKSIPVIQALIVTLLFHVALFFLFSPVNQAKTKKSDGQRRVVMSLSINEMPKKEQILFRKYLSFNKPLNFNEMSNLPVAEPKQINELILVENKVFDKNIELPSSYKFSKFAPYIIAQKNKVTKISNKYKPLLIKNNNSKISVNSAEPKQIFFIVDNFGKELIKSELIVSRAKKLVKESKISGSLAPTRVLIVKSNISDLQPEVKFLNKCGKVNLDVAAYKIATASANSLLKKLNKQRLIMQFNWTALKSVENK